MRFHFSIRALLLVTLASSFWLLVAHKFYTNQQPKRLVAELNEHDVQPIFMNWDWEIGHYNEDRLLLEHVTEPERHELLVGLSFEDVKSSRALFLASQLKQCTTLDVRSHDVQVSPKHCGFKHLNALWLGGFHDAQLLEWLDVADSIERLALSGVPQVGIQCWRSVGKTSRLTHLYLTDIKITWRELEALNGLPSLDYLSLDDCQLEDGALLELRRFPKLTSLALSGTTFRTSLLQEVSRLKGVTDLSLDDSNIGDSDVKNLAKMTHLRNLHLYGCKRLSGACIPDLMSMDFLDFASLLGSSIERHPKVKDLPFGVQEWVM
ncbi:MAG: hypothetical protein AAFU85_19280 [Planctomycetota bacterium]